MARIHGASRHNRNRIGVAAGALAVLLSFFVPTGSAFAVTPGTYTLDTPTVEQGGTVTFTLIPTSYDVSDPTNNDLSYFCYTQQAGDTSDLTTGSSVMMVFVDEENLEFEFVPSTRLSGTSYLAEDWLFDGPGVGSFNPNQNPYTGPTEFSFDVPETLPVGEYVVGIGCISPALMSVMTDEQQNGTWSSPTLTLTVMEPSDSEVLANTGGNDNAALMQISAALAVLVAGVAIRIARRRVGQSS